MPCLSSPHRPETPATGRARAAVRRYAVVAVKVVALRCTFCASASARMLPLPFARVDGERRRAASPRSGIGETGHADAQLSACRRQDRRRTQTSGTAPHHRRGSRSPVIAGAVVTRSTTSSAETWTSAAASSPVLTISTGTKYRPSTSRTWPGCFAMLSAQQGSGRAEGQADQCPDNEQQDHCGDTEGDPLWSVLAGGCALERSDAPVISPTVRRRHRSRQGSRAR